MRFHDWAEVDAEDDKERYPEGSTVEANWRLDGNGRWVRRKQDGTDEEVRHYMRHHGPLDDGEMKARLGAFSVFECSRMLGLSERYTKEWLRAEGILLDGKWVRRDDFWPAEERRRAALEAAQKRRSRKSM